MLGDIIAHCGHLIPGLNRHNRSIGPGAHVTGPTQGRFKLIVFTWLVKRYTTALNVNGVKTCKNYWY